MNAFPTKTRLKKETVVTYNRPADDALSNRRRMTRTITIASGKGGVGKTSISVNLALQLAAEGNKCCLFDADLGLANINILLGVNPEYSLEHIISGEQPLERVLMRDHLGIDILPGGSGIEELANLPENKVGALIESFSRLDEYDYLIFDASSGVSDHVLTFCLASSEVFLVIAPEPTSLVDAYALLKILHINNYKGSVKVVLNNCPDKNAARAAYNRFKAAAARHLGIGLTPVGIIYHDPNVSESVKRQTPLLKLHPDSIASRGVRAMTKRVIENRPADIEDDHQISFWTRYFEIIGNQIDFGDIEKSGPRESSKPVSRPSPPAVVQESSEKPLSAPNVIKTRRPEAPPAETRTEKPAYPEDALLSDFPVIPEVRNRLAALCDRADVNIDKIVSLIRLDPVLLLKTIKLSCSNRHGGGRAADLAESIRLIGVDAIKTIALSGAADNRNGSRHALIPVSFWKHSLACARTAEAITARVYPALSERAYMAGLTHDVGLLAHWLKQPEKYANRPDKEPLNMDDAFKGEQDSGITHCRTGARLFEKWNLPPYLIDAALYHHEDRERIRHAFPLVKCIYTADRLANAADPVKTAGELSQLAGLDEKELASIAIQARKKADLTVSRIFPDGTRPEADVSQAPDVESRDILKFEGAVYSLLHAHDFQSLLDAIMDGVDLIFDFSRAILFVYDESRNSLRAAALPTVSNYDSNDELAVSLDYSSSLLVQCLNQAAPLSSFNGAGTAGAAIIDEAILRMLGETGMYCQPFMVRGKKVGVLAVGISDGDAVNNLERRALSSFAGMAALALDAELIRNSSGIQR